MHPPDSLPIYAKYWSRKQGRTEKTSAENRREKQQTKYRKQMKTKEFETITLKQLKKIARILDDVAIPCSEDRLIYYRLFGDLVTNNQTIVLTKEQYKH